MTFQLRSLKINVARLVQTRGWHSFSQTQSVTVHDKDAESNSAVENVSSLLQELTERLQEIKASSLNIREHFVDTLKCYGQPPKASHHHQSADSPPATKHSSVVKHEGVNKNLIPVDATSAVDDCVVPYVHTCDDILLHQSPGKSFLQHCDTVLSDSLNKNNCVEVTDNLANFSNSADVISRDNYTISVTCDRSSYDDRLHTWLQLAKPKTGCSEGAASFFHFESVDLCSADNKVSASKPPEGGDLKDPDKKPNMDQLRHMQDHACSLWPFFFVSRHDYSMYTADVILENRLFKKPHISQGITRYVLHAAKLRVMAHLRFANVRMQVLKATVSERDGTVMIRWRVSGIPNLKAFMFWKFLPWNYNKALDEESLWIDGFSILYVNGKGFVYKHCIEKMIPEGEEEVVSNKNVAARLALLLGLAPKANMGDIMSWF